MEETGGLDKDSKEEVVKVKKLLLIAVFLAMVTSALAGEVHVKQVQADKYVSTCKYSFLTTRTREAVNHCFEQALYDTAEWIVSHGLHTTGTCEFVIAVDMLRGECGVVWTFRAVKREGQWKLK